MVPQSVDELSRLLVDLQLVTSDDIRQCRAAVGALAGGAEFLELLERRQLLTSFQVQRIQKRETEGLVLGGCKLMYRNASGSFARVYRGCRLDNGQMIGIKVLRDRWSNDHDTVQLFLREGEIGKRLKHPNIVPIFDVGAEEGIYYITMEFVEGGNLRDFLKIRNKLVPAEALQYGLHISRGLAAALAQGITHRDMKLTNVLMSSQGIAKLIDFGLAADDAFLNRSSSPDLAQALEYSTLEKNTGAPKNDPRSDLFFLGTILYELLIGDPPYPRTRDRDARKQFSRYRDIRPIDSMDPSLPWQACAIVNRLLQINPAHRYQTPAEVADEIESALREMGHPVDAAPGSAPQLTGATVLLCVEHRPNRQDILRDYFSRHGYRVLLLGDADRALSRLKSNPPQAVVLFGDAIGDRIAQDFRHMLDVTRGQKVSVLAVLSDEQHELAGQMPADNPRAIVLQEPVRLRDLRKSLESTLQ